MKVRQAAAFTLVNPVEPARPGNETLASQIRANLAQEIISGRMAPGTEIDEQELAQRFSTSRTPVREALRELASSGLVIIEPRRGARVVALTLDRISEMFEVMAEIEAMCIRIATYRITTKERSALRDLHMQSQKIVEAKDIDGYDRINRQFHDAIYQGTHNEFLREHALTLRRSLAPFRRAQLHGTLRLTASYEEHATMLKCIFAGDGNAAAKLMRAHMLVAGSVYAGYAHDYPQVHPIEQ